MALIKSKLVTPSGGEIYFEQTATALYGSHPSSKRDRKRGARQSPLGSNNAHNDARSIEDLIRDCTALKRGNHLAQAVIGARSDHVVGATPTVEARTDDEDWNRDVERKFADWCDHCDLAGQLSFGEIAAAVVNSWDTTGGMACNKVLTTTGDHLRLEMIDVIRLMNPSGNADSKYFTGGVELSESTNRPINYHIADWNDQGTALDRNPKPYDTGNILLMNNPHLQDINQHRTVPRLGSVAPMFETIKRAGTSTWGAYELATYIALFIKRAGGEGISIQEGLARAQVAAGNASSTQDAIERGVWEPLSILEGQVGESIEQIKPEHPTTGFDVMFWTELHSICAGMGIPIELVMMRFDKNYAASRSAIAVGWKKIEKYQKALIRRFLKPVYYCWLVNEQLHGRIASKPKSEWMKCEWFLPSMPVMDEKTEVESMLLGLAGGLYTHENVLRRLNQGSRETFMKKFKQEALENAEAGLIYGLPISEFKSETTQTDETSSNADGGGERDTADA